MKPKDLPITEDETLPFGRFRKLEAPELADRQFLLYGAGHLGGEAADLLQKNGLTPLGFIDLHRSGAWHGLPVFPPDKLPAAWQNKTILVTIFNTTPGASFAAIDSVLRQNGFEDIVFFETFFQHNPKIFTRNRYWLTDPGFPSRHRQEVIAAYQLLEDDLSRRIYTAEIHLRSGGDWRELPGARPEGEQYFDPEILPKKRFHCFIDAGAYNGDTLAASIQQRLHFDRVIAFEPDGRNFDQLCSFLKNHRQEFPDAAAIPAGLSKENGRLTFRTGSGAASGLDAGGSESLPVVALDAALPSLNPDFIKMDIEGAELDALTGMTEMIVRARPILAVCVYHRPGDLFEIPLYLKKILPDYRFYLRLYGEHGFDTVLYALPEGAEKQ